MQVLLDETIKGLPEAVIEYDKYLDKEMYAALDDPALSQMTGASQLPVGGFTARTC